MTSGDLQQPKFNRLSSAFNQVYGARRLLVSYLIEDAVSADHNMRRALAFSRYSIYLQLILLLLENDLLKLGRAYYCGRKGAEQAKARSHASILCHKPCHITMSELRVAEYES